MSKRWYVCPVEGDGKSAETCFRPRLSAGLNWSAVLTDRALVLVSASEPQHATLRSNTALCALPALQLSDSLDSLPLAERTALQAKLATFGIAVQARGNFGTFIRMVGKVMDSNFNEIRTDAKEP